MDRLALRARLRALNMEFSALLKDKSGQDRFVRMAQLKTERATVMGLLAGDGALRLVAENDGLPTAHGQSA